MTDVDVAIIGGGYSGMMALYHLVMDGPEAAHYAIYEPRGQLGRGIAYSTRNPRHVLNVPAGGMSALPEDAEHFYRWLNAPAGQMAAAQLGLKGIWAKAEFVPRGLYGAYLDSLCDELFARAVAKRIHISHVRDTVTGITRSRDGYMIASSQSAPLEAQDVVYSVGHLPKAATATQAAVLDVWNFDYRKLAGETRPVGILGFGLTGIDVVYALRHAGYKGVIHAFTRKGRMPETHHAASSEKYTSAASSLAASPRRLSKVMQLFRAEVRHCKKLGLSWQKVFEMWRPHSAAIWNSLSAEDQRRFMKKLFLVWNTCRHRMAPDVRQDIDAERKAGLLLVSAGEYTLKSRGNAPVVEQNGKTLELAAAFDCRGICYEPAQSSHPLTQQLLTKDFFQPHATGMGLSLDASFRPQCEGEVQEHFYVIGPQGFGERFESTAIPELRQHAKLIAHHILDTRSIAAGRLIA